MIRKFKDSDIDEVMHLWLEVNIQTHNFIEEGYWESNYDKVKQMMPQATIYVYEQDDHIQAFIGLMDNYIAGIFVSGKVRSQGIGKQLLAKVKRINNKLTLHVYLNNERAIKFYQRENFKIYKEQIDDETGETEILMIWER